MQRAGVVSRMLVIAPIRPARLTWRQECEKWGFGLSMALALGTPSERLAALHSGADVVVINPENVQWLQQQVEHGLVRLAADMLVVDESTRFKNHGGTRFKALRKLLPKFKHRYILTGTPMPKRLEDLFGQVYLLDGGQRLGKFITGFRQTYMVPTWEPGVPVVTWTPKPGGEARIFSRISDVCLRLSATDYLTMPELTVNRIVVQLPAEAQRVYRSVARALIATLAQGETVTAATAAASTMKLRQIANGTVYVEQGVGAKKLHCAKTDALRDLIEEQAGQPLLVAVAFVSEVATIREALGENFPYLGGGTTPAEQARIVADWNAGKLPVLLAHPTSVAHGLNLQAGGHAVCWYGLTWAMEEHTQLNARVWRQGQRRGVVIHYIVAQGTVDELMLCRLTDKAMAQERLFDALKRHAESEVSA